MPFSLYEYVVLFHKHNKESNKGVTVSGLIALLVVYLFVKVLFGGKNKKCLNKGISNTNIKYRTCKLESDDPLPLFLNT